MTRCDAIDLAYDLMRKFGLDRLGWRFEFDNAVRRFGSCQHYRKLITLSRRLTELNSRAHVEDTLRHEIAHALAGCAAGHGPKWKAVAIACGAKPERCYKLKDVVPVPRRWLGTCPACRRVIHRNRRFRNLACGRCSPKKWDSRFVFRWTHNKVQLPLFITEKP